MLTALGTAANNYVLFDCPGQVELYTHHTAVANIAHRLEKEGYRLCCVNLCDSHYCGDPSIFVALLTMALSTMVKVPGPHRVLCSLNALPRH